MVVMLQVYLHVHVPQVAYYTYIPTRLYTPPSVHTTTSEPSGVEHGRKRHGSHSKSIALELIYKVKGVEVQVTISPAHRTQKKSVEWLRALKKVC